MPEQRIPCDEWVNKTCGRRVCAGICSQCGQVEAAEGHVMCDSCLKKLRVSQQQRMAERMETRLCVTCGKSKTNDFLYCDRCRAKRAEKDRQLRDERRSFGICVECGKWATEDGKSLCSACLEKQRQDRIERQKAGLCRCGEPLDTDKKTCSKCLNAPYKTWWFAPRRRQIAETRQRLQSATDPAEIAHLKKIIAHRAYGDAVRHRRIEEEAGVSNNNKAVVASETKGGASERSPARNTVKWFL